LGYIACILTLVYRYSIIFRNPQTLKIQKVFICLAVGLYIGGWLFFWIPEIVFCDRIQALNFHAWWHVTSTAGSFIIVIFSVFQREIVKGRKPELNYNKILGIPILPYVHIPIHKKLEIKKRMDVTSTIQTELPILRKKNLNR